MGLYPLFSFVKLKNSESQYRIRVGNYRVIYEIEDEILLILVLKVAHRHDVYKDWLFFEIFSLMIKLKFCQYQLKPNFP